LANAPKLAASYSGKEKTMRTTLVVVTLFILSGCASNGDAPRAYNDAVRSVYIGMEKRDFDFVMRPVNDVTLNSSKRRSEAYQSNGMLYEIVYIRSGWVSDYLQTDDEYTPFLFQDGTLIGYGWAAVGGTKTTSNDIAKEKAGATKVNVQQNNNVGDGNKFKCASDGGANTMC
jgi:hypothetical protein